MIQQHFKEYINSFRQGKGWAIPGAIDAVSWGIIILFFAVFINYVETKSVEILQGKTPEQIQVLLATAPEQVLPLMSQLKSFIYIFLGTLTVLLPLTLFLVSLAGALVWNYLCRRTLTKKTYWRWNVLNLTLLLPLFAYGLLFLIVKFLTLFLFRSAVDAIPVFYVSHSTLVDGIIMMLNNLINVAGGIFAVLFVFAVYYEFTHRYLVWASIGSGIHLLGKHWSILWRKIVLIIITMGIVTALLIPVRQVLLFLPTVSLVVDLIVVLFILSWLRFYLFSTLHGTQQIS